MPPKVIFSSESGRMVSGRDVRAVLPEGREASPGAPRAQGPSWTVALVGRLSGRGDTKLRDLSPGPEPGLNQPSRERGGLQATGSTRPRT